MTTPIRPTEPAGTLRVGVDIGGSKVAVLVMDDADRVLARRSVPAASSEPDEAIDQITTVIRDAVAEAGATMADVSAVGLGVPGRVDTRTGDVTFAVNLGWQHLPLGRRLEAALGVPCIVENDVRAAAVGLHRDTRYSRVDDLIFLGIGTGISAGVVLDGRLHRGVRGMAGEIGHVVLDPEGADCACGLRGCFETIAGGAGIARAAHAAVEAGEPSSLRSGTDGSGPTAADVFAAAETGDGLAARLVDAAAAAIVRIVHELVLAYDVELVVIGGGISRAGAPLLERIRSGLARIAAPSAFASELFAETEVRLAGPDHDIGTRGAIALLDPVAKEVVAREAVG